MRYIILTSEQKDRVWGPTIQPRDLGDGRFVLNAEEVLRPGEHPEHRAFLATLPQEELELPEGEDA